MKIISNNLESGELLVKIEGEVDVYTSIDLKKELTRLIEVNQKKIIIAIISDYFPVIFYYFYVP